MCIKIYIIWCKGKKNVYKIYDVGNWSFFILIVKGDVFVKKVFVSEKFFFVVEFLKELVKLVEVFKV